MAICNGFEEYVRCKIWYRIDRGAVQIINVGGVLRQAASLTLNIGRFDHVADPDYIAVTRMRVALRLDDPDVSLFVPGANANNAIAYFDYSAVTVPDDAPLPARIRLSNEWISGVGSGIEARIRADEGGELRDTGVFDVRDFTTVGFPNTAGWDLARALGAITIEATVAPLRLAPVLEESAARPGC